MPDHFDRIEFAPPAPGGLIRGWGLAILAHGALVAALAWGVQWKREAAVATAEAQPVAQLSDAGGNAFHGLFQTSSRKAGAGWFAGGAAAPQGEAVGMPLDLLSFRSHQG